MASKEKVNRDKAMAADLKSRGIFHGRRLTSPTHANYPKLSEIGSAAFRRRKAPKRPDA